MRMTEDFILCKENNSEIYYNGSTWPTKNFGNVSVIGRLLRKSTFKNRKRSYYFLVQFADGTQEVTTRCQIKKGNIKNKNAPFVYGVGFIGYGIHKSSFKDSPTREYKAWNHMLRRSYSELYHMEKPSYIDCTVDERWHNFQNFCEDIPHLDGYKEWKENTNPMELDKDTKVLGNKFYSKDTCMFITRTENTLAASVTGHTYIGIREDGYKEEFKVQAHFAKKHNFDRRIITRSIRNKKSYKGWTFEILQETLDKLPDVVYISENKQEEE